VAKLGDRVKDKVTGLVGILTAMSHNLFGCDRGFIQPVAAPDMKIPDGFWCDKDSLEVLEIGVVQGHSLKPELSKTGGPMSKIK
jgi:hypothetical protein